LDLEDINRASSLYIGNEEAEDNEEESAFQQISRKPEEEKEESK